MLEILSAKQPRIDLDWVDLHMYPTVPSNIPWQTVAKPARLGGSLVSKLKEHGYAETTPIVVGEWSRSIGLNYAIDAPGAAFIACGLIYMNDMTMHNSRNSGGNGGTTTNVEQAFLFSASKVWDGGYKEATTTNAPDLNAATVLNWWNRMVKLGPSAVRIDNLSGARYKTEGHTDEICAVAAGTHGDANGGTNGEVLMMISHYEESQSGIMNDKVPVLDCFSIDVVLADVPWDEWEWTQYANEVGQ